MIKERKTKYFWILFATIAVVGVFPLSYAQAIIPPRAAKFFALLNLASSSDLQPQVVKSTYASSDRSEKNANFENGDKVYVKIEIYDPNNEGENLVISDRISNFAPGSLNSFKFTKSDGSTPAFGKTIDEAGKKIEFNISAGHGTNKIEYEYKAGD